MLELIPNSSKASLAGVLTKNVELSFPFYDVQHSFCYIQQTNKVYGVLCATSHRKDKFVGYRNITGPGRDCMPYGTCGAPAKTEIICSKIPPMQLQRASPQLVNRAIRIRNSSWTVHQGKSIAIGMRKAERVA
jgi:hypothetical protein